MKLISFDIGIRNLAYCILEGTNRKNLKITHWDLIDILAESAGHDKPLCHKCKKPACWLMKETYACTRHKTKGGTALTKSSLNKKEKEELTSMATPLAISGTTKKELVDKLYTHFSENSWKRCVKSAKQGSVVDLANPIATSLESRKSIWKGADLVVFEQQPDKRMLCVQSMMHMWFVCQGFRCKGVSAVHKLTNIITLEDDTHSYKGRKKTGIVHTLELAPTKQWKDYMMKHPKRDDLCDAFLMAVWVLENGK
jgi:hypothetical protein